MGRRVLAGLAVVGLLAAACGEDTFVGVPDFVDGLELRGLTVLRPGPGGHDVVVAYIGGMSCGLAPSVEVGKGGDEIRVWITVHDTGGCDSMAQEGAVGFDLEPEFGDLEVTAHWG